ncbi:MAG: polymerase, sigma-24 subunit, subfamily [Conexibacter sp.]|nr:polymerase, sigma-24 subunit, subfamily [Conexibacter sp.]
MMNRSADEDDCLLLAAGAGDVRALEQFYDRWLGPVTGFHLRRTERSDVAFDLTAETFAAVVMSCSTFDPARGAAASWLFTIAANKLRDSVRRGQVEDAARRRLRHEPIALEDEDLERVEELASRSSEGDVMQHLKDLPAAQRDAVIARVLNERPYTEIAAELRCSSAVVRQRVRRGLLALRTRLQETP